MAPPELAKPSGKVFLVGAGPGDALLLTLRGKQCLERADVVVYDYLANPVLLDHAPAHAERIYVGRRGRGNYQEQAEVNRLLIEKAREGKVVVRLKGGDPFVFGRGGEEAEAVAAAGLPFEVVPGVTSAIAVPAYAGIPVTHRTLASVVTFVTGHEDPMKGGSVLEWPRLATAAGTLVFLMGMKNLPGIVRHLLEEGKAPDTPVALIRWGTRASQQTVVGTLTDIGEKAEKAGLEPPTVIVIGEVVRLRDQLNWFETKPLFGKRVLVTRAREQAGELSGLLSEQGAEPVEYPVLQMVEPESWSEVDAALDELPHYQWLVFTSVNGVRPFMERLRRRARDVRALAGLRLCAIGPRTAEELKRYGLAPDVVPKDFQAEGLIESMLAAGMKGQRVLIARAAVAREILPDQLREAGAEVRVVVVYRTIRPALEVERLKEQLRRREIDVMTFASSSTVRNFCALFDGRPELEQLTRGIPVACIGPITAETARAEGLPVDILAGQNTIPALVDAIVHHFRHTKAA
ncbi:uroporphyrinogen-III C-methyltransferase [Candidatus Nitrospira bockiana]